MYSSTHSQILTYIMTHTRSVLHEQTQSSSFTLLFPCIGVFNSQSHTSTVTYLQPNAKIHPQTHLHINQVTHSHTHTNTYSHKGHAHRFTQTHTQLQTPWGHTSSPIVSKCCWFSLICRLCVYQSLWLPLSHFPTLSLSARRQVSASIFSSSVAVKLNGIGLIAENQREGW